MLTGRVEKVVNSIQFNSNCRFGNLLWSQMLSNLLDSTQIRWFDFFIVNQSYWESICKALIKYTATCYGWTQLKMSQVKSSQDWMKVYLYYLPLQIDFQLFYVLRTRKVQLLMPFYFQYVNAHFNFCWVDLFMLSFSHLRMPPAFWYVNTQFDFQSVNLSTTIDNWSQITFLSWF